MGIILIHFDHSTKSIWWKLLRISSWHVHCNMTNQMRIPSKIRCESFLIGILHLIRLISLYNDDVITRRGRPYVYPTTVMLRCFVVRIWMRIPSNNALHYYFSINTKHNQRIMKACDLHNLPDRRTFDRRFKTIPVKDMINTMGRRFVSEGFADSTVVAVDSSLIHAKNRHVWHKSAMKNNMVPRSGIDTEARWGFSRNKGWVFGYKLHLSCSSTGIPKAKDWNIFNSTNLILVSRYTKTEAYLWSRCFGASKIHLEYQ